MTDDPDRDRKRGEKAAEYFTRMHDNKMLADMNGSKCAGMQVRSLQVYDRPQSKRTGRRCE